MQPNQQPSSTNNTPWYKQFWPWFLIALPGSVVIAGFITIWISIEKPHQMVTTDYFKKGLAINENKERQQRAVDLGLSFNIEVTGNRVTIIPQKPIDSPLLYLYMQHPAKASQDFTLVFNRQDNGHYQAETEYEALPDFNYRVRLYSPENTWEILDRWQPGQQRTFNLLAR